MKFASRLLALVALVFLASAAPASAQYMFLDTDNDGASTAADKLNPNCEPTTVDVYLWTDRDRLANPATCNDPVNPGDLSVNSYVVNLRAVGGEATFSGFINQQAADMSTVIAIERRSTTEWQRGQGGGTPLSPTSVTGVPYKLMTLTVTGASGTPTLEIAPNSTTISSSLKTSFGTLCPGTDGDNTYKLGVDWFDADGLLATDAPNGKNMPSITAPVSTTGPENSPVSVTATASDADADPITLSRVLVSVPTGSGAYLAGPTSVGPVASPSITLAGTPSFTQSGSTTITWTANDGNACIRTATTIVAITNVDRGPVVTAPASASVNEGSLLSFTVSAVDPDVQTITTFTATGSAITAGAGFVVNAGTAAAGRVGTLTWTPSSTQAGGYAVTFTATNVLSSFAITTIQVNDVSSDNPPIVTAPATASVNENSLLTVTVTASDADGPAITSLTVAGTVVTAGATFAAGAGNTSGTLTWTPSFTQSGSFAATFTATNVLSGSAATTITVNNVDRAPTVTAPGAVSVNEGSLLTVSVTAADPDGNAIASLTAAGTAVTAGATFAAGAGNTSGTLSWTPTSTQSGSYAVTFTAANALSGSASTAITVNDVVSDVAPVVTAPATASVNENSLLTFTVSASDAEAITSLTATGTAITAGATFAAGAGNTSGTFSWTPTFTQSGSFGVTFTATNALSGSASTAITVNNVDRAPVVTAPATASVNENSLLTVNVTAADADGDAITSLTATGSAITAGATFAAGAGNTSGTLSWTPSFTQSGSFAATFTATNALSGSASTAITVNNVDRAPTVTAPGTQNGSVGILLTFTVSANDPDGNAITSLTAAGTAITAGATFTAGAGNTSGTLSWTPASTGTFGATFTAANALSGSASTSITVAAGNPPIVTAPATASVNENSLLTINVTASDADGPAITSLTATGSAVTAGATFAAGAGNTSGTLTWTPTFAQSGSFAATFTASNTLSGSASTAITVNNVDRAPVVTAPATASVNEGSLLTVNVTAADIDGDAITSLTATGTAVTGGATFAAGAGNTSGTLSWTPSFTQSGSFAATFTATNALSGSASTAITVNDVTSDAAPVVTAPATASVNENSLLTINVTANDADGPAIASLTAAGTAITAGATFAAGAGNTSGQLTWTPSFTQSGSFAATFTATNVLSGSASTAITVNNIDRAPVVTAPATASVNENSLLTVNITAADADGNAITSLTATGTAVTAGATFAAGAGNTSGTLSWTPTFTQSGSFAATFTATNALSGSASTAITVNNVDRAPVVTAPATASGPELTLITFTVSANDADGDAIASLTAAGTAITAGATFGANGSNTSGTFNWTPSTGQSGSYGVTFTATNALSGSASTAVSVGADLAPVVTAPATASVNENSLLTINVTASDADGPAIASLTATGSAITAGATFAANGTNTSGTFSWTPTFTQSGSYGVTFTATNTRSGSASTAITVNNVDRAPVVTAPATASVTEGSLLTVNVTALDVDGDAIASLTASGTAITAGAAFAAGAGNTTGALTWTPTSTQAGSYSATFTATNALSGSAATAITVGNLNQSPIVTAPSTASVNEGQLLTFGVSATDADGDHVSLAMSGGAAGTSFLDNGDNTGTFSWTPSFSQAGPFTVTFTGNDGNSGTGSASTAITVNDVNRAPTADAGGPYSGVTGVGVNLDGTGSADPDGDVLTYAWTFGDGETGSGATVSHSYATVGSFTVTLTVTDPGDLSDSDEATVNIADVFPANAFVVGGNKTTRLGAGKPFTCVQVEPVNGSYDNSSVNLSSLVMIYGGQRISASASKTSTDGDKNQNGISEIAACFTKEDLRSLFAGLSGGAQDVNVTIEGNLSTGGRLHAELALRVVASGGGLNVMASPNPLNPDTELSFSTSRAGRVRVQIFDLAGRLVKTVLDEPRGQGYQSIRWNGSDQNGGKVASGIYYFRIQADGAEVVHRVTVLK